jgi:hypothetical protein
MPHGTTQAALGLGDGSKIGTDGNVADADNTLDALVTLEVLAAEITVDSTNLDGTATTVQAVLEELETQVQLAASTHVTATGAHAGTSVSLASAALLVGVGVNAQTVAQEMDDEAITARTYRPLYSTLTADSANIQNDTLTATGLSVTVPIAGTYELDAFIPYTTPADQDIQFKFLVGSAVVTGTVGTSDIWIVQKPTGDITAGLAIPLLLPTSWTTAVSIETTGAGDDTQPVIFKGKLVVTTAGTISIQFAQVTTGAFNTHVSAGAWFKLQRVA